MENETTFSQQVEIKKRCVDFFVHRSFWFHVIFPVLKLYLQNTNLNTITCEIKYYNLLELKEIRSNLNNTSIIKSLNIKSLSHKNIKYDIYYYGNFKILNDILEINKLKIYQIKNSCSIRLI